MAQHAETYPEDIDILQGRLTVSIYFPMKAFAPEALLRCVHFESTLSMTIIISTYLSRDILSYTCYTILHHNGK